MSDLHEGSPQAEIRADAAAVDQGLRRYMPGIHNKVGLGLLLAATVAYATASVPWLHDLLFKTVAHFGARRISLTFLGLMLAFGPAPLARQSSNTQATSATVTQMVVHSRVLTSIRTMPRSCSSVMPRASQIALDGNMISRNIS